MSLLAWQQTRAHLYTFTPSFAVYCETMDSTSEHVDANSVPNSSGNELLFTNFNFQPVERVYEEDNTPLITHILINCPFCKDSFIYEMGLIYHMLRNHFSPYNECKKYIAINEEMLMMIATAIATQFKENKLFTTESLLYYLNSYGCRIDGIQQVNLILETSANAIQYFLNNNTTIQMTRYTEINKIIQFIGEGVDANKDIVLGDTKNLKIIAEKYVELKYNKKIGKKNIAKKIKDSIKILQGKSVICNSKFILSIKTKLPAPEKILLLDPPFQNFFNKQSMHQNKPPQSYINDRLPNLENINDLDDLMSTIIKYNMYQAIDDYQGHDLQKIVDLKIELIKLNIIIRYIDILNVQTDGIISPDGFQIINNRQFINRNCICTIDLEFKKFINETEHFWMHPYFELKNTVYMVEQYDSNVISLDSERIVKFEIPSTPALHEENYNELLVVTCLKTYFSNAVKSSKHSLNNIYKHIEIIMVLTKFQFINKKYLKITLNNLIQKQYIVEYSKSNYTLYKQAENEKIDLLISKFHHIKIINYILNVTKEKYLTTAEKYELSTSVYENTKRPRKPQTQENNLMDNIQKKVVFIKKMLNSITESQQTTMKTIHNTYTTKLKTYKQLLNTILKSLPKTPIDNSFTADELLQNKSNLQLTLEPMTRTIPSTPRYHQSQQLHKKFYTQRSELQDYIDKYYK